MVQFFTIGTIGFWALFIITFIILTVYVNKDEGNGWLSTLSIVLFGAFVGFTNQDLVLSLLHFITDNPLKFILYIILYVFAGAIWSVMKWYFFLVEKKNEFIQSKIDYPSTTHKLNIPLAKDHKGTIILWMSYWIPSLFWTFINQWVSKVWTKMFNNLESVFNKISKSVFKDIEV